MIHPSNAAHRSEIVMKMQQDICDVCEESCEEWYISVGVSTLTFNE
jgi:hypothetical protein